LAYRFKKKRQNIEEDNMMGSYLGNEFSQNEIQKIFDNIGADYKIYNDEDLISKTASDLSNGKAVGWFQGRMEFGPRALGNRSILADPRSADMQKNLNLKIKYRESFRPFAPSVLKEDLESWFEMNINSTYMLFVENIKKEKILKLSEDEKKKFGLDLLNIKKSIIPAVTHVDYSARIQTVTEKLNKKYFLLIKKFKEITNCPVLVNTSFNIRGEPIVSSPEDAYKCFMGTELDILVVGNCYIEKINQNINLISDYKDTFELD
jgi:carbamoyltransferase